MSAGKRCEPRFAPGLLLLIPRRDHRELIRDDLREEYRAQRTERGARAATWRYRLAAAESVADWWVGNASWKSVRSQLGPRGLRHSGFRSGGWLSDVRFAIRMIRREPIVAVAVILTVTVGIGSTTAVSSVLRGVLVSPLPLPEPEQLVRVSRTSGGEPAPFPVVGLPDLLDWRERSSTFAAIAGWSQTGMTLTGDGDPERISVALVTEGMQRVLGIRAAAGRFFTPIEHDAAAARVAILEHGFWVRRFGGDPAALGTTLVLDAVPHRVVGVLPPTRFDFPPSVDAWVPLAPAPTSWMYTVRGASWLNAVGRVRSGTPVQAAEGELSGIQRALVAAFPRQNEGQDGVRLERLKDVVVAPVRPAVRILALTVGVVLLLACANVGVLLLSRANRRRSELAVRSVLGGTQPRLLRLLLTETTVLAAIGGAAGILLAQPLVHAIVALYPGGLPRADEIRLDVWVLGAAAVAIALSGLVAGAVPGLAVRRLNLASHLRQRGGGSSFRRQRKLRDGLVALQLGVSAALLIGATLFGRTLLNLRAVDPGFEPDGVLAFRIAPAGARYPGPAEAEGFYRRLLDELEAVPGVDGAGAVNFLPFAAGEWGGGFEVRGEVHEARVRIGWPGYHEALGLRLDRGRFFAWTDDAGGAPVALLNEAAARRAFGGESPLGRAIEFEGEPREVVGVLRDIRHDGLTEGAAPEVHVPGTQFLRLAAYVVLRTSSDPTALVPAARRVLHSLDPAIAITDVATMNERIERSIAPERFRATLVGSLGGLAALLALIGVYGVMSYAVSQRRREIGIRMALGARSRSVLRSVLGSAGALSAVGVGSGAALAWAAARWMESFLYGVSPRDALTFVLVPAVLLSAGLVSALGPAVRASRLDPLATIREE